MSWRIAQTKENRGENSVQETSIWDHSSHERFYDYYAMASQSKRTLDRFRSIRDSVLRVVRRNEPTIRTLEVADIGCGAGAQCLMWAELGHHVHGLDINEPLLKLARDRAASAGYVIDFRVGSAVELPWIDESMDVCLVPELIEHIAEWKTCLKEFARILRPGGILFISTSNKLCPIQYEFNLPFYSWYPAPLKHYFEHLAVTRHPKLVNYARYPAVNWFSFNGLKAVLSGSGFQSLDRFDVMDLSKKGTLAKLIVGSLRPLPILRWLAQFTSPGTVIVAVKRKPL